MLLRSALHSSGNSRCAVRHVEGPTGGCPMLVVKVECAQDLVRIAIRRELEPFVASRKEEALLLFFSGCPPEGSGSRSGGGGSLEKNESSDAPFTYL